MYHFILDNMLLPVAPEKLTMSINNQNKTVNLINDGEINLVKSAGLTTLKFQVLLPQIVYPFAEYLGGFVSADKYVAKLQSLKTSKKSFRLVILRLHEKNRYHTTNITVAIEDLTVIEDANNGADIIADIVLREVVYFTTQKCNISFDDYTISRTAIRETSTSPFGTSSADSTNTGNTSSSSSSAKSYTVVKGDCLWNIAKSFYGDGSKYPTIYTANKTLIDKANEGTGNPLYTIYPNQVFTIPAI